MIFSNFNLYELAGPDLVFVLKSYTELVEKGLAQEGIPFYNQDRILMLKDENQVKGCIVYRLIPTDMTVWVVMTAVNPDCRGMGIHKMLHTELNKVSVQGGFRKIMSFVFETNESSLRAYEKFDGARRECLLISRVPS